MLRNCLFWCVFLSNLFFSSGLGGIHRQESGVSEESRQANDNSRLEQRAKVDPSTHLFHNYRRQLRRAPNISKEDGGRVFFKQASVRVEFAVDSSASKTPGPFRCILIRNAIAEWTVDNCTSPLKLDKQIRKEGTYRLDIFKERRARRKDVLASKSWIIDRTPPRTKIVGDMLFGQPDRRIVFTAKDAWSVNSFQCRLDKNDWFSCQSPHDIIGAGPGRHTFEVRAIDEAGNRDKSPAIYSWISSQLDNSDEDEDLDERSDLLAPLVALSDDDVRSDSNRDAAFWLSSGGDGDGGTASGFFLVLGMAIYIVFIASCFSVCFYTCAPLFGPRDETHDSAQSFFWRGLRRVRQETPSSNESVGWRDSAKKIMVSVQRSAQRLRN